MCDDICFKIYPELIHTITHFGKDLLDKWQLGKSCHLLDRSVKTRPLPYSFALLGTIK
jgi:hypothetical protein